MTAPTADRARQLTVTLDSDPTLLAPAARAFSLWSVDLGWVCVAPCAVRA